MLLRLTKRFDVGDIPELKSSYISKVEEIYIICIFCIVSNISKRPCDELTDKLTRYMNFYFIRYNQFNTK